MRVAVRDDFAHGFVIGDDAHGRRRGAQAQRLAVDADAVMGADALAHVRHFAIDAHAAFGDEFFHFQPRTQARLRQHFVQFGAFGFRGGGGQGRAAGHGGLSADGQRGQLSGRQP